MENKFCRLYGYLRCFHWLTASALIEFEFWQLNVFLLFKIFYSNLCDKLVICAPVLYCHFYCVSICASVVLAVVILSVCLSVCPSVTRMLCDKTKQCTADILIPHEKAITLVFRHQQCFVGDALFYLKFVLKVIHPFEKCRFQQISAYNISAVTDSKKVQ